MSSSTAPRAAPAFQAQYTGTYTENVETVKKGFWKTVRNVAGKCTFLEEAIALYFCAIDPATPYYAKAGLFSALAYFVLPIDLVMDALPGLGLADDAAVISAAVYLFGRHIKQPHRDQAKVVFSEQLKKLDEPQETVVQPVEYNIADAENWDDVVAVNQNAASGNVIGTEEAIISANTHQVTETDNDEWEDVLIIPNINSDDNSKLKNSEINAASTQISVKDDDLADVVNSLQISKDCGTESSVDTQTKANSEPLNRSTTACVPDNNESRLSGEAPSTAIQDAGSSSVGAVS